MHAQDHEAARMLGFEQLRKFAGGNEIGGEEVGVLLHDDFRELLRMELRVSVDQLRDRSEILA